MSRDHRGWIVLSRELLTDLLDLLEAEVKEAGDELGRSWKRIGRIALLAGTALFLLFWLLGLGVAVLVLLAVEWLSPWGAGLAVFGLLALVVAVLGGLAYFMAKRLANPLEVVIRRLRDHLDWWRSEVAQGREEPTSEPPSGGAP